MSLIHNERTKLTAAWLNTIAAALVVVGGVSPVVVVFGGALDSTRDVTIVLLQATVWIGGGGALHLIARGILAKLRG